MVGVLVVLSATSAGLEAAPKGQEPAAASQAPAESPPAVTDGQTDERVAELERRVAEQEARIRELEARSSTEPPPAEAPQPTSEAATEPVVDRDQRQDPVSALTAKEFPRSIPMFGSDFRFAVGGYVKLDALYDFTGHPDHYRFSLAQIPKPGDPGARQGYLSIHANETRFKLDVRYFGRGAPANQALVEIDFFTPSQTSFVGPRLRHAYLRWGDFLAGQTWALLTDMRPLPFIIDFAFADSINATRVPQLRYQSFITDFFVLRLGVEMPETTGVDNPESAPGAVSPRLPRAAVGGSVETKRGFVSGGVSLGEIRWDADDQAANPSVLAWMTVLNGRVLLDHEGRGFIGAHASIGEGTGELIGALAGTNANATLAAGDLEPMLSGHGMVGAGCRWLKALSTNAAVAWDVLAPSAARPPEAVEWAWSVHANVIGHLEEPLQIGIEGMLGESADGAGRVGRGARIQTMAMYSF